jgi:cellulose synthase/poly-beta-1,6-N-acetylglucosamine synthase-like glycosyltransferase
LKPVGQPLPVELGFLASHGWPIDLLHAATAYAALADVSADQVMIKHGLISEDAYYRALAEELAVPFVATPRLGAGARFPHSIHAGFAPVAPPARGFVFAPQGRALQRLLASPRRVHSGLRITTPGALTRAIVRRQAVPIAAGAAHELPTRAPHLSIRDGGSGLQLAALCALTAVFCFGAVHVPALTMMVVASLLAPLFLTMVGLRLVAAGMNIPVVPAQPPPRAPDAALPVYSVVAALYREPRIVPALVEALSRLDYPAVKLDIKLVIEADDRQTAAALSALKLPAYMDVVVAPPGLPRTKPRALNVALPLARGTFVVVYDAEDLPDRNQLRLAVARFAEQPPDVACLQARLLIENWNDSWVTRLFAIEYATLFDVINPALAAMNSPVPLGGTSNHFRVSALRSVLGWDAWNVTEDADLGIRLARLGYRVADLPSSTREEAPRTLKAWMNQRRRWMKGFIQTCLTHSRTPVLAWRDLGFWRLGAAMTLTFGAVVSALGYPFFTVFALIGIAGGQVLFADGYFAAIWAVGSLGLFGLGLLAMIVPACVALIRRRALHLLPWVPVLPFYYGFVSLATLGAMWDLAVAPFHWHKTDHGLAKSFTPQGATNADRDQRKPRPAAGSD